MNMVIDDRDGTEYPLVEIGGVTWLGRNLSYFPQEALGNRGIWVYGFDEPDESGAYEESRMKFGCLYTWPQAINTKNYLPGFRLPNLNEFRKLQASFGYSGESAYSAITTTPGKEFGFIWAGVREPNGKFSGRKAPGVMTGYWSSEEKHSGAAWSLSCIEWNKVIGINYNKKNVGLSVRLVRAE